MRKSRLQNVDVTPHPEPSRITPSIWWIGRGNWGGLPALTGVDCNVYLLRGDKFDVLVDPGWCSDLRLYEKNIRALGGDPARIGGIWLTHLHWDHSRNVQRWQRRRPGLACRLSDVGAAFLRRGDWRLVGAAMDPSHKYQPPVRFIGVKPGATVRCDPWEFRAVPLPGHTPDCMGFRGRVDGLDVMFTGDAIIGDQGEVRGNVGWLDGLWLSDVNAYEQTLKTQVKRPPGLMLPGHGAGHAGASVGRSMRNCLWRIRKLMAIPHLGSMMAIFGDFAPKK